MSKIHYTLHAYQWWKFAVDQWDFGKYRGGHSVRLIEGLSVRHCFRQYFRPTHDGTVCLFSGTANREHNFRAGTAQSSKKNDHNKKYRHTHALCGDWWNKTIWDACGSFFPPYFSTYLACQVCSTCVWHGTRRSVFNAIWLTPKPLTDWKYRWQLTDGLTGLMVPTSGNNLTFYTMCTNRSKFHLTFVFVVFSDWALLFTPKKKSICVLQYARTPKTLQLARSDARIEHLWNCFQSKLMMFNIWTVQLHLARISSFQNNLF